MNPKNKTFTIFCFDFAAVQADREHLMQAWISEIENVAALHTTDNRLLSFVIAALRLGKQYKLTSGISVKAVVEKAGYSRSLFFRLFLRHDRFLLTAYQHICMLGTKVYKQHMIEQELSLEEFCTFTIDVLYGARLALPKEIVQTLWSKHALLHREFHPHIQSLAKLIQSYLSQNPQTQQMQIELAELDGVLTALDLSMLNAMLEDNEQWGLPSYYNLLKKMLYGYLLTCK